MTLFRKLNEKIAQDMPGITVESERYEQQESVQLLRASSCDFIVSDVEVEEENGEIVQAPLVTEHYVTLARHDHKFVKKAPTPKQFAAATHVLVSDIVDAASYAERLRKLDRSKEPDLDYCATAFGAFTTALQTDILVGTPASLANLAKTHLKLKEVVQPFRKLKVTHYLNWHRANERDECHAWLRGQILDIAANGMG